MSLYVANYKLTYAKQQYCMRACYFSDCTKLATTLKYLRCIPRLNIQYPLRLHSSRTWSNGSTASIGNLINLSLPFLLTSLDIKFILNFNHFRPETVYHFNKNITSSTRNFVISLYDEEYKYLTGHIRNGNYYVYLNLFSTRPDLLNYRLYQLL